MSVNYLEFLTGSDFTGYIDKFFSKDIYYFSNEKIIADYTDSILKHVQFEQTDDYYFQQRILRGRNQNEKGLLQVVLTELIQSGALKMRRLIESVGMEIRFPTKKIDVSSPEMGKQLIPYIQLPSLVTLEILSKIMGGGLALSKGIKVIIRYEKSLSYRGLNPTYSKYLVGIVIPLLDYHSHKFDLGNQTSYQGASYGENGSVLYRLTATDYGSGYYFGDVDKGSAPELFILLDEVVERLLRNGILK